jgi:cell division septum initiation protein DivIVA
VQFARERRQLEAEVEQLKEKIKQLNIELIQ